MKNKRPRALGTHWGHGKRSFAAFWERPRATRRSALCRNLGIQGRRVAAEVGPAELRKPISAIPAVSATAMPVAVWSGPCGGVAQLAQLAQLAQPDSAAEKLWLLKR
jgi:hypothetical protein